MKKLNRRLYYLNEYAVNFLIRKNELINKQELLSKLVDKVRNVKSIAEYNYLLKISQKPFVQQGISMKGYPVGIQPILSEEGFHIVEFALENGDIVSHPFALADGLNENFNQLLHVMNVSEENFLTDIFVKECLLYVSTSSCGNEVGYYLHNIEALEGHC